MDQHAPRGNLSGSGNNGAMQAGTIHHVIWDWNGTLLDDTLACVNAINTLLARRGRAGISTEHYRETFGFPVIDFYRRIDFPLEHEDWDRLAREFHDLFLTEPSMRLQEGALEMLARIQQREIPQSILSASEQGILSRMLDGYGIRRYFTEACGVGNLHGASKMELGQGLLRRLALAPGQVLLIGDTLHDAEVAHALGIRCALVAQGHQSARRLAQANVAVFASVAELGDAMFPSC